MKRRQPTWSPIEGEQFEMVVLGNVTVKLYRRERRTATGKRAVFELADYSTGRRRLRGFDLLSNARRAKAKEIASQLSSGKAAAMLSNSDATSYVRGLLPTPRSGFVQPADAPNEGPALPDFLYRPSSQ